MLILPAIDILDGKCVRLFQGDYSKETVYSSSPIEIAKKWEQQGAEFIHLVDLDGAKLGKPVNLNIIKDICNNVTVPCELGGGIRSFSDAEKMLLAGVSRVILGTAACKNENLVFSLINKYGPEKIVIGIDAKDGMVAVEGWLESSSIDAYKLAVKFAEKGVKRFIYTDILRDGALIGPNFDSVTKFCTAVPNCNVIASGGVGNAKHVKRLEQISIEYSNLEGVIIGKALYANRMSLKDIL